MSTTPSCLICGAGGCSIDFAKSGHEHWTCGACGHLFVHPMPSSEQLAAHYNNLSDGFNSTCSWDVVPRHQLRLWRTLLSGAKSTSGMGPLLDVGCGSGHFLQCAAECGWRDLYGIDLSEDAVSRASESVDAELRCVAFATAELPTGFFSVVSMFDVIEHLADPMGALRQAHRSLRPGGVLMVAVPHGRGLSMRAFGKNTHTVCPPEHVSHFSIDSLRLAVSESGFAIREVTTRDLFIKEWVPGGKKNDVGDASEGGDSRRIYTQWYDRLTSTAALRLIPLVNVGLNRLRLGDYLVLVAVRC